MRPYYLDQRPNGFYRVRFVDQKAGLIISEKSTHKKCFDEALSVVNDWLRNGIPSHRVNAHISSASAITHSPQFQKQFDVLSFAADLASGKITDEQASIVFALLSQKFGTTLPVFAVPQVHSVSESPVTGKTAVPSAPTNTADCRKKIPEELQEELELAKLAESSIGERKLVDFLTEEWAEESSKHLDDKEIHGRKNTKRYCYDMRSNVHAHIKKYFGDELVKNITSKRFNEFLKSLVRNGISYFTAGGIFMLRRWLNGSGRNRHSRRSPGHLSPEMTKQYANHKTRQSIEAVESAMNDTYRQIIQFPGDVSA